MSGLSDIGFPSTHWSLIRSVGKSSDKARQDALSEVLSIYQPALSSYLRYYMRIPAHEADDCLQEFLTDRVIEKGILCLADPTKGRFRSFISAALRNFAINYLRKRKSQVKLTIALQEFARPSDQRGPDRFDVEWARNVIEVALERMRAQCDRRKRPDIWEIFKFRTLDPILGDGQKVSYSVLVARFRLPSAAHAANLLVTANRMFQRVLRGLIGEYVLQEQEIDQELDDLRSILSAGPLPNHQESNNV